MRFDALPNATLCSEVRYGSDCAYLTPEASRVGKIRLLCRVLYRMILRHCSTNYPMERLFYTWNSVMLMCTLSRSEVSEYDSSSQMIKNLCVYVCVVLKTTLLYCDNVMNTVFTGLVSTACNNVNSEEGSCDISHIVYTYRAYWFLPFNNILARTPSTCHRKSWASRRCFILSTSNKSYPVQL